MSKSPSLRRIQADIRELAMDPSDRYHASPLENDMFEWHFTIRGADDTDFEGGIYHGRILLPAEYPFKPPNIVFLTPSGRFETGTKLCLSFSAYHPELWQPAWGIRLILEALISFLPTKGDGAIGALDWTSVERKRLAKKSVEYCCPQCGSCSEIIKAVQEKVAKSRGGANKATNSRYQKEIEQLHSLHVAAEGGKDKKVSTTNENNTNHDKEMRENSNMTNDSAVNERKNNDLAQSESSADTLIQNISPNDTKPESTPTSSNDDSTRMNIHDQKREEEVNTPNTDTPTAKTKTTTTATTTETTTEPPNTQPPQNPPANLDEENDKYLDDLSWLSDVILHIGIVLFSILACVLFHKIKVVIDDLKELEERYRRL